MDDERLRAKVTKDLRRAVDEVAWEAAIGKGLVDEVQVDPASEEKYADLVAYVRDVQGRLKGRSARRARRPEEERSLFSPGEQLRANALYEYFAARACNDPLVRQYRSNVLGSRLLPDAVAREFLTSDLAQWFPVALFVKHGVSPVRHTYRVLFKDAVEQGGRRLSRITIEVQGVGEPWTFQRSIDQCNAMSLLSYPAADGWVARVRVNHESVLDDLQVVANQLSRRFPWEEYQATWFVLTGAVPLWWPVRRSIVRLWDEDFEYQALTLVVEPWAPASTVLRAYRAAQQQMLSGRENRPLRRKNLELFRFCNVRMADGNESPDWGLLALEWNEAHPAERVGNPDALKRIFNRVQRQLVFPSYGEPW
jgi:hypothetical protein